MKNSGEMERTAEKRGVPMRRLHGIMILLACVMSVFLLYSNYKTMVGYGVMRQATERYIVCQRDAADMQEASDYLTDEVRFFAATGEPEHVQNYFTELQITRRREKALEELETYFSGTETYEYLKAALAQSNELLTREYYSMRLMIEARSMDPAAFPEELQSVILTPEDRALSPAEKEALALSMVCDDVYQDQKDGISADVSNCLDTLTEETKLQQRDSSDHFLELLRGQGILIGVLLITVFAVVFLTSYLVIHPLKRSITHIRNQEALPMAGSRELQFLAETYNAMFEQSRRQQDQLSYEATHDNLTGLYNRGVFEKMRETCDSGSIALMLIDVDRFKEINDAYGHDVGDRVLKKVAGLLQHGFRSDDFVCRIGGDEFAIIMVNVSSEQQARVYNKIQFANSRLMNPDDGLPPVSLSVGVAFGDRQNPTDDIYKDADTALYRAKKSGRADCAFY